VIGVMEAEVLVGWSYLRDLTMAPRVRTFCRQHVFSPDGHDVSRLKCGVDLAVRFEGECRAVDDRQQPRRDGPCCIGLWIGIFEQ